MEAPKELILKVEGLVNERLELTFNDLDSLCETCKVEDVGKFIQGWKGQGVWLNAVMKKAGPTSTANHVTFHSSDGFAASVELSRIKDGVIVYKRDDKALTAELGGPLRLVLPQGPSECSNIKRLARIELTVGKGKDTTPKYPH